MHVPMLRLSHGYAGREVGNAVDHFAIWRTPRHDQPRFDA